ncbi:Ankyrin-1 [Hyphodiscus hymeniophilus]|uniref:Ankyrin-1 n=1 Tax=Hyphodiscus hymeniophilus TaxID=353542 RepID=A0A9P6VNY0_9HELO|nr:Ankyrin-1 [Hyphodiscus hymeniophilus]
MDGLSVAASIAGLVSLADTVFRRTYQYYKTAKNATQDINKLATGIRTLSSLLHGLELVVNVLNEEARASGVDSANPLDSSNLTPLTEFRLHELSDCLATLTNIQKVLDKHQPQTTRGRQLLKNLKWPFSVHETKRLLDDVEKHKSTINIAVSGETLATVLNALSRQDDIATDVKELKNKQIARWAMEDHIRLDKERREILSFFGKIDPSSNHNMSLNLRHPMTGLWLTEGLPFQTWLRCRNSKLWLSGIPGAGKTITAALVIEEAMKQSSQDQAAAYFYCDYKDSEKQDPINILGSLASQLARQHEGAFSKLEQLYHTCHPKDKPLIRPETEALALKLYEMTSCFADVSIIVDGLDECGSQTTEVVESLAQLASHENSNVRVLLLSRDESDIREILCQEFNHLEIAAHSDDLRLYVAAEIEARQKKFGRERLRIRSIGLKDDIMKTLVDRAQGMFRWVACQLDYLCSLPNDAEKRKALVSLPPGLNATYERILERVNHGDESVQRMGDKSLDKEAIYEEEEILLHCSSLIRRSEDGQKLEMAHFTVKEYLSALSPTIHSPYSRYSQSEDFVLPRLAVTCLTYITFDCFHETVVNDFELWQEQVVEFPFRKHALLNWVYYVENRLDDTLILGLVKKLFDPAATRCFQSWVRDSIFLLQIRSLGINYDALRFQSFTFTLGSGNLKPLHLAAAIGLPEICQWLLADNCDVNDQSMAGTPVHCALLGMGRMWKLMMPSWCDFNCLEIDDAFRMGEASQIQVFDILISYKADCDGLYRDRTGKEYSCAHLSLLGELRYTTEHPLLKLVAAGIQLDDEVLNFLADYFEFGSTTTEFTEALLNLLMKENTHEPLTKLKIALKLNCAEKLHLVKAHSTALIATDVNNLVDLLYSAIKSDQAQLVEDLARDRRIDLLTRRKDGGQTFLHFAAGQHSVAATRILLSLGAEVNAVDEDGNTPLILALQAKPNAITQDCISLLIDHGADVRAKNFIGSEAVHYATTYGYLDASKILLRAGADINALLPDGKAPIHFAASWGHLHVVKELLSHHCSLAADNGGMTPRLLALKYGHPKVFDLLKTHEAQRKAGSPSDLRQASRGDGQSNSMVSPFSSKELKFSIERGDFELVKALDEIARYLVQKGAHYKGRLCTETVFAGYSVVHLTCTREENIDILRDVLDTEPLVSGTPLHLAAYIGNCAAAELLLRYEASVDATDSYSQTPLVHASRFGHVDAVQLLLTRGANPFYSTLNQISDGVYYTAAREEALRCSGTFSYEDIIPMKWICSNKPR